MEKRTLEQVEKEINETKASLADVHGTETEVYARIVGYYRAVNHWNRGKRDEFDQRKMFTLEASNIHDLSQNEINCNYDTNISEKSTQTNIETISNPTSVTYEMFTRKTCPNCPPVKDFMSKLDMPGRSIDVDTPEGLSEAAEKGVFASPTVIFYNESGVETARCHDVEELEAVFNTVSVIAE